MATTDLAQITKAMDKLAAGDRSAAEQLFALLYDSFRDLAARYLKSEKPGHTLSPTALVHEAYLKLVDQSRVDWQGRTHFLAVGAQAMRRILVDHARGRKRAKRGGGRIRIQLAEGLALSVQRDEDVLAVDEALAKLAKLDSRQATIVELRFFGGLSVAEVAEFLGLSKRTIEGEWTIARAWLRRELGGDSPAS
ncbi:MAG: sigma-70 family RNA polymerase sigma factor [Phycisphaerae bacterium]|nr:sigma-70 family RNA polymerase sigma factor [Phycisphaerae bacterium]